MKYLILFSLLLIGCNQAMTEQEKQTLASYRNQINMGRQSVWTIRQKEEYKALLIKELQQPFNDISTTSQHLHEVQSTKGMLK